MTEMTNAVVLDYACGNGSQIARYLRHGAAAVVAIDISPVSVATATRRTSAEGSAGRCVVVQRDCEATGFPGGSFDLGVCGGTPPSRSVTGARRMPAAPSARRRAHRGGSACATIPSSTCTGCSPRRMAPTGSAGTFSQRVGSSGPWGSSRCGRRTRPSHALTARGHHARGKAAGSGNQAVARR